MDHKNSFDTRLDTNNIRMARVSLQKVFSRASRYPDCLNYSEIYIIAQNIPSFSRYPIAGKIFPSSTKHHIAKEKATIRTSIKDGCLLEGV